MARKFFYVCAGLFLLVASYHFGASSARAQAGVPRAVGDNLIVSGNALYQLTSGGWQPVTASDNGFPLPVQPSDLIAAWAPPGGAVVSIVASSGEGWVERDAAGWQAFGPVPGATGVTETSWGAVKQRYR